MPTYLLHGFRWPRQLVRIHIILQNLDDAAAEWLVAPKTTLALLKNFNQLYPDCMEHLSRLRFVEQYDPNDQASASQPFAYVADMVEEVKLGVEIEEVRGRGVDQQQWESLMELRDKLAPEEKVGWYIVVCGDEERAVPPGSGEEGSASGEDVSVNRLSDAPSSQPTGSEGKPPTPPGPKGLKKLFPSMRLGRRKSRNPVEEERTNSRSRSQGRPTSKNTDSTPPPIPGSRA